MNFLKNNIEKILAWIANILWIFIVYPLLQLSLVFAFGFGAEYGMSYFIVSLLISFVILILPLVPTILMRKKKLSAFLFFLLAALVVFVPTVIPWIVALLYLVVALLLLFKRK